MAQVAHDMHDTYVRTRTHIRIRRLHHSTSLIQHNFLHTRVNKLKSANLAVVSKPHTAAGVSSQQKVEEEKFNLIMSLSIRIPRYDLRDFYEQLTFYIIL